MRSHRRRSPIEHILLAGEIEDLGAIQAVLAVLPADAYGQVLLEVDTLDQAPVVIAPLRVTVVLLEREHPREAAGELPVPRGARLADAVGAWVAEWMPADADADRVVTLWIGGRASDPLNALCAGLAAAAVRL